MSAYFWIPAVSLAIAGALNLSATKTKRQIEEIERLPLLSLPLPNDVTALLNLSAKESEGGEIKVNRGKTVSFEAVTTFADESDRKKVTAGGLSPDVVIRSKKSVYTVTEHYKQDRRNPHQLLTERKRCLEANNDNCIEVAAVITGGSLTKQRMAVHLPNEACVRLFVDKPVEFQKTGILEASFNAGAELIRMGAHIAGAADAGNLEHLLVPAPRLIGYEVKESYIPNGEKVYCYGELYPKLSLETGRVEWHLREPTGKDRLPMLAYRGNMVGAIEELRKEHDTAVNGQIFFGGIAAAVGIFWLATFVNSQQGRPPDPAVHTPSHSAGSGKPAIPSQ